MGSRRDRQRLSNNSQYSNIASTLRAAQETGRLRPLTRSRSALLIQGGQDSINPAPPANETSPAPPQAVTPPASPQAVTPPASPQAVTPPAPPQAAVTPPAPPASSSTTPVPQTQVIKTDEEYEGIGAGFYDCNICFEVALEPVLTPCGHLFCWPCIYQWLNGGGFYTRKCPICMGNVVLPEDVIPIYGRGPENPRPPQHRFPARVMIPPRPSAAQIRVGDPAGPPRSSWLFLPNINYGGPPVPQSGSTSQGGATSITGATPAGAATGPGARGGLGVGSSARPRVLAPRPALRSHTMPPPPFPYFNTGVPPLERGAGARSWCQPARPPMESPAGYNMQPPVHDPAAGIFFGSISPPPYPPRRFLPGLSNTSEGGMPARSTTTQNNNSNHPVLARIMQQAQREGRHFMESVRREASLLVERMESSLQDGLREMLIINGMNTNAGNQLPSSLGTHVGHVNVNPAGANEGGSGQGISVQHPVLQPAHNIPGSQLASTSISIPVPETSSTPPQTNSPVPPPAVTDQLGGNSSTSTTRPPSVGEPSDLPPEKRRRF